MTKRRTLLEAAVSLPFFLSPGLVLAATSLLTLEYEKGDDYSTLIVTCPTARKISSHLLKDKQPHRFVIDLEGVRLTSDIERSVKSLRLDKFITRIRVGQFKENVLRLVVELKRGMSPAPLMGSNPAHFSVRFATAEDLIAVIAEQAARLSKNETAKPSGTQHKIGTETIRIVIDPGHGGADPGAIGKSKIYEKTVVLEIAKKLAAQINRTRGMKAYLTRSTDQFLKLRKRAQLAVDVNAHLFVSIHADAWMSDTAYGASIFTLSERGASSLQAQWLSQSQNKSDEIGGVDISSQPKQIHTTLIDLQGDNKLEASMEIGNVILKEIGKIERLHKSDIEYAEFAVLKARGVPSILIESGFLSNPDDERRLKNPTHQTKIAQAICRGIIRAIQKKPGLFVRKS